MPENDEDLVSNVLIDGVAAAIGQLNDLAESGSKAFNRLGDAAKVAEDAINSAGQRINSSLSKIKNVSLGAPERDMERIKEAAINFGAALVDTARGFASFGSRLSATFAAGVTSISGFVLGVSKLTAAARGATVTVGTLFREQRKLAQQNAQGEIAAINFSASLRRLSREFQIGRDSYAQYSESVRKLREDYRDQMSTQAEIAEVQNRLVQEQERLRQASAAYDAQLRLQIAFGKEAADSLIQLGAATEKVQFIFRDAFSPAFAKIFDVIGQQIEKNIVVIQKFADTLGKAFTNFVNENADKLPAIFDAVMQTMSALGDIITGVILPALRLLGSTAETAAGIINTLFGTDLNAGAVLAAVAIGKVTGAFSLLLNGIRLVLTAVTLLTATFGGPIVILTALAAAVGYFVVKSIQDFGGLQAVVQSVWDAIVDGASALVDHVVETWQRLVDDVTSLWETVVAMFTSAGETISAAYQAVADGILQAFEAISAPIKNILQGIISMAQAAVNLVKQALGAGGDGGDGFASGGHIRGRGTGTSDSIPIWASNGEFMMKAAAVRKYGLGLMYAINNLRFPIDSLGKGIRGFSVGGLIGSLGMPAFAGGGAIDTDKGGGRHPFELIIGDQRISGLNANNDALAQLQRYAVMARVRSTGRKPNWSGK